ncbi:MAG: phosphoenolpyruvate--protein phosphotransferase [Eubacteriales bacterium]|nr:phosphoenolpyruvate--protein phosphotransferase [Eubacteriales bacterium]
MKELSAAKTFTRGIAIGPIFRLEKTDLKIEQSKAEDPSREWKRFEQAVAKLADELLALAEENPIFAGHLAIANDPMLADQVKGKIEQGASAEQATHDAVKEIREVFAAMEDEYLREREDDVRDIGERLILTLQGKSGNPFEDLKEPSIILAQDLLPSDTAKLPLQLVLGFITAAGGVTSHVAIMSKSLGVPALVGVSEILEASKDAKTLAFNAASGEILIDPDAATEERYRQLREDFLAAEEELKSAAAKPALTTDGKLLKVYANLGSLADLDLALPFKPEGVGLFRSEFLFMNSANWPSEDEQFEVYKSAITALNGGELILRTLDIGGDKALPYYSFPVEENPFLGWRAIRFCLDREEMFKTQLKAALRASAFGDLKIMYPMIVSPGEFRRAKALCEAAQAELKAAGIDFDPETPQGIMVETPAAVLMAEELAQEVDFFSIGTNDLTQYVLACDRGNNKLAELYNPLNPAVLRAIYKTIKAANEAGIEVGMCGEFAGRPEVTELLLGFGLDEFSMSAGDMAVIKNRLQQLNYAEAKAFALEVLRLSTIEEVEAALKARA